MPSLQYHPGLAGKMPMKGRRASATKTVHTAVPQVDADTADIEDFAPPEWRTVLNNRADLGYPDFYPSRPGFGQTEDVLSEEFVKNGFSAKTFVAVGAESFSMHGPIFGHLMNGCLGMLNQLGQEVAEKRDDSMPQFGERIFRIPIRVTYNDAKRLQFLTDLANPSVPLHRLMRNPVPHGFKGTDLFESLFSPQLSSTQPRSLNNAPPPTSIPIDRAIWFIRVLGANEITAHRARAHTISAPVAVSPVPATPSSTNTAPATNAVVLSSSDWYTQDFTLMFTSWLRIQINQLALPAKPPVKTGLPAPKTAGILGDDKARTRWLAKWDYSMKLLRELRGKHLFSTRIFVSWLVDTLAIANLAQVGFIAQLISQHLVEMGRHVIIARPCVRAACMKISEINNSPAANTLFKIETMLKHIVLSLANANPQVLLSPALWSHHRNTLENILTPSSDDEVQDVLNNGSLRHPCDIVKLADEMRRRSERLVFRPAAMESTKSPRRQQMEDLHKLDAMDADTNMTNLCKAYFDGASSPTSPQIDTTRLEDKIFVLLNWAMGLFQLGVHRAYAVDTLLTIWLNIYNRTQSKLPSPKPLDLFPILYKWLDISDAARSGDNAFAIGITFGDLTRQGLFPYDRYLKELIAQGHSARSSKPGEPKSHHLPLLAAMPIFVQAKDLELQRKVALCGDDEDAKVRLDEEEESLMSNFRDEVREYVPEFWGTEPYGRSADLKEAVFHNMPAAPALNRYMFLQARFWIGSAAADGLKGNKDRPAIDASTYARVIHIYHLCNGFSSINDALTRSEDEEILDIVIDTIRRDADVWTANDKWALLTNALMDRNNSQDERGRHHSGLSSLLLELAQRGRLSEEDEEEVRASVRKHIKESSKGRDPSSDASESMGPLYQAISTGNIAAAKILAPKMFSRHGSFPNWASLWWTTLIKAIHGSDRKKSSAVIEAALAHIEQVDDIAEGKLDKTIGDWLELLSPVSAFEQMASRSASILCEILLNLVAQRRARIVPKILDKLAYTCWKQAASSAIALKGRFSSKFTQAVTTSLVLSQQLLLTVPPNQNLPPINLRQSLVLQTERVKAMSKAFVPSLIRHLPFLVILDKARGTSESIRVQISTLLESLARTPCFKAAAFRHLHILKDAFLSNEWSKPGMDSTIEGGMVNALKLIMSQSSSSSSAKAEMIASLDSSARFSAWRWTSVVLSMRVEFKRLAIQIENGEDSNQARQTLKELVHTTLDRDSTADDTDLLCETFRGIESVAAQEILAVGMERLTGLLSQMINAESQATLEQLSKSTDLMLRVLDSASTSLANEPCDLAVLAARHGLLDLISLALQSVERQLTSDEGEPLLEGVIPPRPDYLLTVLLNLIKFMLGLNIVEPTSLVTPRPDFGRLSGSFLRVLLAVHDKSSYDTIASLVDTLAYIVDSAPVASRIAVHTALLSEMITPAYPATIASQPSILAALPFTSPPHRNVSLANTSTGEAEGLSLDDRPWEFFESFDAGKRKHRHGEMFLSLKPLKDNSSIPISLFGPKMKRDAVPLASDFEPKSDEEGQEEEGDGTSWMNYVSERNLGNGVAGEPVSVRQSATGLYANPEESREVEDDAMTVRSALSPTLQTIPSSPTISITSNQNQNRPRRASTRQANTASAMASANLVNKTMAGSNFDPITFEDSDSGENNSSGEEDESDIEILEAPAGKRPRRGGKTVAGKSTRKTTGGKGVARKGVSGKSVRGGKAPTRGGYRR